MDCVQKRSRIAAFSSSSSFWKNGLSGLEPYGKNCNRHRSRRIHRVSFGQVPPGRGMECHWHILFTGISICSKVAQFGIRPLRPPQWSACSADLGKISANTRLPLGGPELAHLVLGGPCLDFRVKYHGVVELVRSRAPHETPTRGCVGLFECRVWACGRVRDTSHRRPPSASFTPIRH